MSKNRARNRRIERAAMPISTATSGPVVTIPQSVWNAMINSMAPQKGQAQTFSPGAPLQPIPGITPASGPRQWSYNVGQNLNNNDRTMQREYVPAFQQLRLLAQTYSAIGMAERIWCDLIPRMELQVTLTDEQKAQGKDDKDFQKEITGYRNFFSKPDGVDDIHEWLRKAVVDQTQVDALVVFKRRTRGGKLAGLDLLDGTDIKPLLDERGRVPVPPYAAYQQYSYGTPGQAYTTDDMIYYRESPRTFSSYGFSRVERVITIVNIALRKQNKDLYRYTEGNIPAGIMEVPETAGWTPDQIDTFEQMWNSLLAGNAQQQVRIKFTQPGMKYTAFDQAEAQLHLTEFDTWLENVVFGSYGVSLADAGVTGDIHKSADDGQQNMLYRRTVEPLAIGYGRMFTNVLHDDFGDTRFQVKFAGYDEKEDVQTQVAAFSQGIQYAMISPSDAAAKLGWPDVPKTGPLFIVPGGITPLASFELGSDARQAQDDAKMAGLQMAANPPDPNAPNPGGDEKKQLSAPGQKQDAKPPEKGQEPAKEPTLARLSEMMDQWDEQLSILRARNVTPWAEDDDDDDVERYNHIHSKKTGEFGTDTATKGKKAPAHHKGTHHTTGKGHHVNVAKAETALSTRASKAAARFAKLASRKVSKHWTAAQQAASAQAASLFTKLADGFEDGKGETAEHLMKQILAQGAIIYGANSKQYASLQKMMTSFDKRMDKIGIDRVDMPDEFEIEDTWIDEDIYEQGTQQNTEDAPGSARDYGRGDSQVAARSAGDGAAQPQATRDDPDQKALSAEYRRWRQRAIDDVKATRAQRGFTTTLIPEYVHTFISRELDACTTPDDVRFVFTRASFMPPDSGEWQKDDPDVQAALADYVRRGVVELEWLISDSACSQCIRNAGERVKVGQPFPTGAYTILQHPGCNCRVMLYFADGTSSMDDGVGGVVAA